MSPRMKPAHAATALADALGTLDDYTATALNALGPAMEYHLNDEDAPKAAARVVADIQDLIRRLRDIESLAARAIGQAVGRAEGELPDGRLFKMHRTADRKAWQHDRWQGDARAVLVDKVLDELQVPRHALLVEDTGEVAPLDMAPVLQHAMTLAEAVHGAGAPKTTALKALGLDPGDYCETVRGTWKLDTVAPSTPTTTTTDSGEQNG